MTNRAEVSWLIPSNRTELIPSWLFFAEALVCIGCAPLALLSGPGLLVLLFAFLVTAYAFGAFDVVSLTRHHAWRAPFLALAAVALLYGSWVALRSLGGSYRLPDTRAAATGVVILALPLLHTWLKSLLVRRARDTVIDLPCETESVARILEHHLAMSGYPAVVRVDGQVHPSAGVTRNDRVSESPRTAGTGMVDPLHFCDIALRLLPPDLVAMNPDFLVERLDARRSYLAMKRFSDIAISVVVLLLSLPLWLFAAIGILIFDGAPILYRQQRVGQHGHSIKIMKFRTLRNNEGGSQQNRGEAGTPNDTKARAFGFGTLLRRTRIDELPQLLMVLSGSMSLVGPRPEMLFFHQRSLRTIPLYEHRLKAKPGLSGWAQIRYTHSTTDDEYRVKTAYDFWYLAHRGVILDTKIALRTVGILLNRFGSR